METIIYSQDRFSKKIIGGLISIIKLFTESAPPLFRKASPKIIGFPLNDFCLNYKIMGFLEIGGRPIKFNSQNRVLNCIKGLIGKGLVCTHLGFQ